MTQAETNTGGNKDNAKGRQTLKMMKMNWNSLRLLYGFPPHLVSSHSSMWALCICNMYMKNIDKKYESFVSSPWCPFHWSVLRIVLRVGALETWCGCLHVRHCRNASSWYCYSFSHTLQRTSFSPQVWRVRSNTYKKISKNCVWEIL